MACLGVKDEEAVACRSYCYQALAGVTYSENGTASVRYSVVDDLRKCKLLVLLHHNEPQIPIVFQSPQVSIVIPDVTGQIVGSSLSACFDDTVGYRRILGGKDCMASLLVQTIVTALDGGDKDVMLFVFLHLLDAQVFDACFLTVIPEGVAVISAQTIVGTEPKVTLFVLEDMAHSIGCKAIGGSEVTALQHMFCPKAGAEAKYNGEK